MFSDFSQQRIKILISIVYKDTIPVVKTNTTDEKNRREHTAVMLSPTSAVNANDFLRPVKWKVDLKLQFGVS